MISKVTEQKRTIYATGAFAKMKTYGKVGCGLALIFFAGRTFLLTHLSLLVVFGLMLLALDMSRCAKGQFSR